MNVAWTQSERFSTRRELIERDADRWADLMRAIEGEITQYPSPYPLVPDKQPWRMFKVRPDTEGFPGMIILFSIREGNSPMCVLEDVMKSDDPPRFGFTDYIAESDAWVKENVRTNGHGAN